MTPEDYTKIADKFMLERSKKFKGGITSNELYDWMYRDDVGTIYYEVKQDGIFPVVCNARGTYEWFNIKSSQFKSINDVIRTSPYFSRGYFIKCRMAIYDVSEDSVQKGICSKEDFLQAIADVQSPIEVIINGEKRYFYATSRLRIKGYDEANNIRHKSVEIRIDLDNEISIPYALNLSEKVNVSFRYQNGKKISLLNEKLKAYVVDSYRMDTERVFTWHPAKVNENETYSLFTGKTKEIVECFAKFFRAGKYKVTNKEIAFELGLKVITIRKKYDLIKDVAGSLINIVFPGVGIYMKTDKRRYRDERDHHVLPYLLTLFRLGFI